MHYIDVIMTTMASQITSLTIVYSTVYSDADQRNHQSSASLAFVWGIHWDRWIPRTKGQLRGKFLHLMTSSWFSWMFTFARRYPLANDRNNNQSLNATQHHLESMYDKYFGSYNAALWTTHAIVSYITYAYFLRVSNTTFAINGR